MVIRLFDNPATVVPQLAECPDCRGRGELSTGRHEHATGAPIGRTCSSCSGVGQVLADDVVVTVCCATTQWPGTGCPDHDDLCDEHRPGRCCAPGADDGDWNADSYYLGRGFAS